MKDLISIIVPLHNEEENVHPLVDTLRETFKDHQLMYELILVDDGSKDNTFEEIKRKASEDNRVKGIRFRRNYGQTVAITAGFDLAQGDICITMDGDMQHDPEEISVMDSLAARRMAGKGSKVEESKFVTGPTQETETVAEEEKKKSKKSRISMRRGMYHCERGRVYRRTRREIDEGVYVCPKCKGDQMERQPFTKSVKILICPTCGWKISTDKIM